MVSRSPINPPQISNNGARPEFLDAEGKWRVNEDVVVAHWPRSSDEWKHDTICGILTMGLKEQGTA
jgi:hypothetical protein